MHQIVPFFPFCYNLYCDDTELIRLILTAGSQESARDRHRLAGDDSRAKGAGVAALYVRSMSVTLL